MPGDPLAGGWLERARMEYNLCGLRLRMLLRRMVRMDVILA